MTTYPGLRSQRDIDVDYYVRNQNPYTHTWSGGGYSPDTHVANSWADLVNAANWRNNAVASNNQSQPLIAPYQGNSGGGINWGAPAGAGGGGNPFEVIRNKKFPELDAAVSSVLGGVNALNQNPNQSIFRTTKDQAQQRRVDATGANFDSDSAAGRQSLTDFTTNYLSQYGKSGKATDEDVATSGRYLGNQFGDRLRGLSSEQYAAEVAAGNRGAQEAVGASKAFRLGNGESSYANALMNDALIRNRLGLATSKATRDRENQLIEDQARTGQIGRRSGLLMDQARAGAFPVEFAQNYRGRELGQVGQIGELTDRNTIYQTPEELAGRQIAAARGAAGLLNDVNFVGLRKPYEADGSGLLPFRNYLPSRGGGYSGSGGYDYPPEQQSRYPGLPTAPSGQPMPQLSPSARDYYFNVMGTYPEEDASPNMSLLRQLAGGPRGSQYSDSSKMKYGSMYPGMSGGGETYPVDEGYPGGERGYY